MASLTINAELPAPAPVQKRKVFALGLIRFTTSPIRADEIRPAEEMRVMGLMMVEDQAGRANPFDDSERE